MPKDASIRSPEQEAAIRAAIAHLDYLLQARRAMQSAISEVRIRSAVLDAAMAIVEEPAGDRRALPGMCAHRLYEDLCPQCSPVMRPRARAS